MAVRKASYSVLVTGANRGIGLEFVRQLANHPNPPQHIIATCRDPGNAQVNVMREWDSGIVVLG